MTYKKLTIERGAQIVTVTLTRQDYGNALSLSLMREIIEAANSFKYDTEIRVVIIKGQGRNFCVGADLKDEERWKIGESGGALLKTRITQIDRELINAILGINQVTIACLHGAAAG